MRCKGKNLSHSLGLPVELAMTKRFISTIVILAQVGILMRHKGEKPIPFIRIASRAGNGDTVKPIPFITIASRAGNDVTLYKHHRHSRAGGNPNAIPRKKPIPFITIASRAGNDDTVGERLIALS